MAERGLLFFGELVTARENGAAAWRTRCMNGEPAAEIPFPAAVLDVTASGTAMQSLCDD
jgi:hypothetical protein